MYMFSHHKMKVGNTLKKMILLPILQPSPTKVCHVLMTQMCIEYYNHH